MLRRFFSTPRKVLVLDYTELLSSRTLFPKIEEAYSPDGLGVLFVKNIPQLKARRAELLPMARQLALLPEEELKKIEVPEAGYSIGWSHGKEKFLGEPDLSKGSFYANPENDYPRSTEGPYHQNIWPKQSMPALEPAFKSLGALLIKTGSLLARHLDRYISHKVPGYAEGTLYNQITKEYSNIARLLHYFPKTGKEKDSSWCGWHNDHGALTALTSSIYTKEESGTEVPVTDVSTPETGLFVMARNGDAIKAGIPADHVAFQIGESIQILSDGWLYATPHCVKSVADTKGVSRNTFAVFMQPGPKFRFPTAHTPDRVFNVHKEVTPLKGRYVPGATFGEFHAATFKAFKGY